MFDLVDDFGSYFNVYKTDYCEDEGYFVEEITEDQLTDGTAVVCGGTDVEIQLVHKFICLVCHCKVDDRNGKKKNSANKPAYSVAESQSAEAV